MWGVGEGRWDRQHYFLQSKGEVVEPMWTAMCGAWMRHKPRPAPTLRYCAVCEINKRAADREA